jgi:predicted metal-dependent phosphotriesterase family hydrolase
VAGDVPAEALGVCDAHDHLFFGSPQLPGQELRSVSAARADPRPDHFPIGLCVRRADLRRPLVAALWSLTGPPGARPD